MPRVLGNAISVTRPYKAIRDEPIGRNCRNRVSNGGNSQLIQEKLDSFKIPSLNLPEDPFSKFLKEEKAKLYTESQMRTHANDGLLLEKISNKYPRKNGSTNENKSSLMVYEFNKVCKTIGYLSNPVSEQLYREMKERVLKSAELKRLQATSCHKEHEVKHEPPCLAYYSPKPSQTLLKPNECGLEYTARRQLERNSTAQVPMSTVKVYLKRYTFCTFLQFLGRLQEFGEIENITQISKSTYRVIYRNLESACKAVSDPRTDMVQCTWYHRNMNQMKFQKRGKKALQVITTVLPI